MTQPEPDKDLRYFDDFDKQQINAPQGWSGGQYYVSDNTGHIFRNLENALLFSFSNPQPSNFSYIVTMPSTLVAAYAQQHAYVIASFSLAVSGIYGWKAFDLTGADVTSSLTWSANNSAQMIVENGIAFFAPYSPGVYTIIATDGSGNLGTLPVILE